MSTNMVFGKRNLCVIKGYICTAYAEKVLLPPKHLPQGLRDSMKTALTQQNVSRIKNYIHLSAADMNDFYRHNR